MLDVRHIINFNQITLHIILICTQFSHPHLSKIETKFYESNRSENFSVKHKYTALYIYMVQSIINSVLLPRINTLLRKTESF